MRNGWVLAAALAAGCALPPTVPVPVPSPLPRVAGVSVVDAEGRQVAARGTLVPDTAPTPVAAEGLGRLAFTLGMGVPACEGAWLTVEADGYARQALRVVLPRADDEYAWGDGCSADVVPVPPADAAIRLEREAVLPRLVVDGQFFRQATGARWTAIGATDFHLYGRWLAGEDVGPVLQQRAEAGFNLLRVWTAYDVCPAGTWPDGRPCQPIGRLVPREHAGFYDRLPEFLRFLARHGLYAELVAFTGEWGTTLPSDADKLAHWDRLVAAAQGVPNVLLELVNEHDHEANRALVPLYGSLRQPPAPVLASHGSGQADQAPLLPIWTHGTYHPGFGPEWMRKAVHNGMEDVADKYRVPVLLNETTRFPDNDGSLEHAYDVGRGCALLQAGCVFHSVTGKRSGLWQGLELALAREWARGARSVDLACQAGLYRRYDSETFLRVYERVGVLPAPGCLAEVRR